ncbi:MAG: hypothetical protein FWH53_02495 [Leptospirales bacterium]|nr:hypothetical protein [Leptospirales bacterium]
MSEGFLGFLNIVKVIILYLVLGALASAYFYHLKRKDLFGGFIGGLVVGVIGALIGGFILDMLFTDIVTKILLFLSEKVGVNLIAGFIGAYAALYIMNRLNHNKERKKY